MTSVFVRLRALAVASVAIVALSACGSDSDPTGPTTGTLSITITGVPAGSNASVAVTGPNGFSQTVSTTGNLTVNAGTYTIAPAQVTAGTARYIGTATPASATVSAGGTATVTVAYTLAATPSITLSGSITANRRLTADTAYVLRGFVYVQNGATLTIEAGTKIVGDTTALGSALFIMRGARIDAQGTAAAPIVLTSQRSAGNRSPGDWGGLIIVGNARSNRTGSIIVEGSNGSVLGADPAGTVYTGGTVDTDNSGTLRYVRVEFAGYATLADAELNSFTFAALGSGTTLEYLQALAGLDDSFEWFGGTVNGRYLVSYEAGDDHFDGSEGYRGLNQFLIAMQSTYLTPRAGAGAVSSDPQGFEIDGCSGGGCTAPPGGNAQSSGATTGLYNMNVFANFTVIGTGGSGPTVPSGGGVGMVLRRGTGGYYVNGVVANWPRAAISLRDSTSNNRFIADSLIVRNLYFADNGVLAAGANFDAAGTNFGQDAAFAARTSNITVAAAGTTTASLFTAFPATITATTTASAFDWAPSATSAIASGGLSTFAADARIAARVGTFITPTAYRGAAAPGGVKWWQGWTNYARN